MYCCENCFKDKLIKSEIQKIGFIGSCSYCNSSNVRVIDTSVHSQLSERIINLVEVYEVSNDNKAKLLEEALSEDWDIFTGDSITVRKLVEDLCKDVIEELNPLFNNPVILSELYDKEYLNDNCIVKDKTWSEFSEHIKYHNRFHNDFFNADAFASMISAMTRRYEKGDVFYRARFANGKMGLGPSEMYAPPIGKRTAGRVNPEEISVLYLSSDPKTGLYEIRSHIYDYVSLGKFVVKKPINLVDLSSMDSLSPFQIENWIEKYAVNRLAIKEIANEIAKPLRRSDTSLEYLPTQYIVECVKSQGYDGVEYTSTIKTNGKNIALFDESLVECVSVQTVEVSDIDYSTKEIIAI